MISRDASTGSGVEEFRIEEESAGSATTVFVVYGDADLHSAPELHERLSAAIEGGATNLVVDLSETTVVDSTSLGVLLRAMKRLRADDGRLALVVPRPQLRRVFEITMLDRVLQLHETQEDALAAFSDGAG